MKLTITDDNKEAGPDVVFVGISIFASIVGMLNKLHCLPRDAEQRNGADLPQHSEACDAETHAFLRDKAGHKYCHKCGERLRS